MKKKTVRHDTPTSARPPKLGDRLELGRGQVGDVIAVDADRRECTVRLAGSKKTRIVTYPA